MRAGKQMNENRIEISDNNRIILDGIESIKEFGEGYVTLKLKKYSVKVEGNDITVSEFTDGCAVLEGQLFSVSFLYV